MLLAGKIDLKQAKSFLLVGVNTVYIYMYFKRLQRSKKKNRLHSYFLKTKNSDLVNKPKTSGVTKVRGAFRQSLFKGGPFSKLFPLGEKKGFYQSTTKRGPLRRRGPPQCGPISYATAKNHCFKEIKCKMNSSKRTCASFVWKREK